jgi:hypothetical protein
MPRISIADFRARLAERAEADPISRAYQEMVSRTDLRHRAPRSDWIVWSGAPEAGRDRLHFGDWVTWPPAASR